MELSQETNLEKQANKLGRQLNRLEELELESEGDNAIQEKIKDLYYRIADIEDDSSEITRRSSSGNSSLGLFKSHFIRFKSQRKNELQSMIQKVQKEMEVLEKKMGKKTKATEQWTLPTNRRANDEPVGMKGYTARLKLFLKNNSKDFPFFVVYGMGGLGKTTLVRKVYNQPDVRHEFEGCAWITAPHQFQAKTLLQDIWSQIHPGRKDEIKQSSDIALVRKLHESLKSKKYFIVLDDVHSKEVLLNALPTHGMLSKVVMTTREKDLAKKIVLHKEENILGLRPLTAAQSWDLFLKTQLPCHSSDLHGISRDIVRKCAGVPLAIMVLGDLMAGKNTIKQLELLNEQFILKESGEQGLQESMTQVLELSYNQLPWHLKNCLLYLAIFPEDTDIEAEKLYNLWIAEGMIACDAEQDSYSNKLQKAEKYLSKLAALGFVQVQEEETPKSTRIKSCRLHVLVRDLCSRKGKEEKLVATVDLRDANNRAREATISSGNERRLAFYFDNRVGQYDFPMNTEKPWKLRSFFILNAHHQQNDEHLLLPKSLILKDFRLLRVLDFNSLNFHMIKFPKDIQNLASLRYLSFRDCHLEELPPSICKLSYLEILDLRVNPMLDVSISNVLCKLTKLRSLYFPFKFHAVGVPKLHLDSLTALEVLKNFNSTHCLANDLKKLDNIKYFAARIEGNIQDLEVTISRIKEVKFKASIHLNNFDCYSLRQHSALSDLLTCDTLQTLQVEGYIGKLSGSISENLTGIFLNGSELKEDPMPKLGSLPKLQNLGIYNSAFIGDKMDPGASCFPTLRYLKLSNLPDLRIWTVGEGAMLKLSTLIVERCHRLRKLPDGLESLKHLKELSIVKMSEKFMKIYESKEVEFDKIKHVPCINICK